MNTRIKNITILLMAFLMLLTGCSSQSGDGEKFKEDYESLNGLTNDEGQEYRVLSISPDNPMIYTDLEDIVSKMKKGDTFIVYFGSNWCPWCRSVITTFLAVCQELEIEEVYYVDVRVDNDISNDIRDEYSIDEEGNIYQSQVGTDAYHEFIELAKNILSKYSRGDVTDLSGTEYEDARRVGAPSFILIKDGEAIELVTGVSSIQASAGDGAEYMELTDEIIEEMESIFTRFLNDYLDAK